MGYSVDEKIGQRLMLAFVGKERIPDEFLQAMRAYKPAGITLFRSLNIDNPAQLRHLTGLLQDAAREAGLPPLLIAADQEGGQLMTIGAGVTQLPGNMALGAVGDPALAWRAGEVLGRELKAMGVNVNYAPCCDVNVNPENPVVGIRSFGADPAMVGELAGALVKGIQSLGVAATAKHFPGHGDVAADSHYGLPRVSHRMDRLQQVELPPFQSAIKADVRLVMTAHVALTDLDGPDAPPATLSASVLKGLLRAQLGFRGVSITDAMDMHAIGQGEELGQNAVRAALAGADLLLMASVPADQRCVFDSLKRAVEDGSLKSEDFDQSLERIAALKRWIAEPSIQPDLSVVGSTAHQQVAAEIAQRSVTLVRNEAGLLPLHLEPEARVAVVVPKPKDLTPADTSSYVVPMLAAAMRAHHPHVEEFTLSSTPEDAEVAALLERLHGYDLIVLGTINAFAQPGQVSLVSQALKLGIPTIVVALRLPYDLAAFPAAQTYACSYSILEPSMRALADAIFGKKPFVGHLPVSIPGLYSPGYAIRI